MTLLGFGLYRLFSTKPEREAGTHFHGGGETETVFEPDDGAATSTLRVYRPEGLDGL
jgi:hypothetical protein